MQQLGQKRGEFGLRKASAELALGSTHLLQAIKQGAAQLPNIIGSAVGERCLGKMPSGLDGVELRSVSGQTLKMQSRIFTPQSCQRVRIVNRSTVPHDDHLTAQVTQQIPEEVVHFIATDIVVMQTKVQSKAFATRTDRQTADDRNTITTVVMVQQGCLPARRPRAPHRRYQHEPGFVDKDEVGAQPRGFFLIRGHSSRFQRRISASLRSSARRCGFWHVNLSSCSSRAT